FRGEDGSLLPSALSLRQRLEFLEKRGVRFAVVLDFSPALARTDGEVFLKTLVRACNLRYLAEGQDFRCGWKGSFARDSIADLAEKEGFSFDLIADVEVAGERASSSRVRTAVASAGFALASELLGRPFEFDCRSLRFVKGAARLTGRQVCPPDGEYAVEAALSDGRTASCQCRIQDGSLIIMLPQEYSGSEPVSVRF
ncbi:MAG: hypothetical protein IJR93_11155, partial [Treponema sp.]|nr:hypothetical protein [Treponema sp.]